MENKLFNDPVVYGPDSDHVKERGWRARLFKKQGMYGYAVEKLEGREWTWRCGKSGLRTIGALLLEVATETDGVGEPLCCEPPLARRIAAKIEKNDLD